MCVTGRKVQRLPPWAGPQRENKGFMDGMGSHCSSKKNIKVLVVLQWRQNGDFGLKI